MFSLGLLTLFSLCRYMLAEGLSLSGIVSILFTGIVSCHSIYMSLCDMIPQPKGKYYNGNCLCLSGHEALYLLKLVYKFSAICVCIFSSDIFPGRDICVYI